METKVTIESLGGLGEGIGSHEDKPVFVPKSVVGDVLRVRIIHETSGLKRGEIIKIIKAGEQRRDTPCLHFAVCGGCRLQQMQDDAYREFKERIARNALQKIGSDSVNFNMVFLPPASRRRVEFKLLKEGGKWRLAYLGNRSHIKAVISNCLILEPDLQKIISPLQEHIGMLSFVEEVAAMRLTRADNGIELVLSLNRNSQLSGRLNAQAKSRMEDELKSMFGVLKRARIVLVDECGIVHLAVENADLTVNLGDIDVPLPNGAFLQATDKGQALLTEFVVNSVSEEKSILDLFCGIGTYSIPLAKKDIIQKVHAVDTHKAMISSLRHIARTHAMTLTTKNRNLFTHPFIAKELQTYEAVVLNPPRAGAKAQCEQLAQSSVKKLVMVSCNPATFVRDALILKNAGFMLKDALAIDQFVWSPHLEIAANFVR